MQVIAYAGGIASNHDYHLGAFLREYFAHGAEFPSDLPLIDLTQDLPKAEVKAFSIDDSTTTEIDDAFSVQPLTDGTHRVGIHIAAQCGVSNTFVASLRKGGDTRDKVKYVTPTGKVMEKAKIKKKEKEPVLKEAPPPPPEDQTKEAIDMLVAENEQLKDRLAVGAMEGSPEERAMAEQTITELREEVRILKIELTAVKSSRDTFQAENQQLKAQIKMLNSKLKKAGVE